MVLRAEVGRACYRLAAAAAILLGLPSAAVPQNAVETARAWRRSHEAAILADFTKLLALPNVASDSVNIRANARFIADELRKVGVQAEVWQRPGAAPLVYGELRVPGARRTLGLYAHYDGQPVNPAEWRATQPWQPALYSRALEAGGRPIEFPKAGDSVDPEWRIYARSAGDDKAPIAALLAVLKAGVRPTSNLILLLDGEEEAGSPNLRAYLEEHHARLARAEAWLFFDGPVHQSGRPQIVFGVRGVTGFDITVYGAVRGLHSGHYGNWSPNPALMLAQLFASMKDETGRVTIDGFYQTVAPVGEHERAALAALPDYNTQLMRELGLARTEGTVSLPESLLQPSLNIRGFTSGNTGDQASNVIPATATASVDIRLVKGNDPRAMLDRVERHIAKQGYHIVREEPDLATRLAHPRIALVRRQSGYPAARAPMDHPVLKRVVEAARRAAGQDLLLVPTMGGSLPLYLFTDLLGRPVIITPIANYDNNQHSSDENLRVGNLWYAIDLVAAVIGTE